jgi:hypothetical protein
MENEVDVGFGANRQEPVGSIAGNRRLLHPVNAMAIRMATNTPHRPMMAELLWLTMVEWAF